MRKNYIQGLSTYIEKKINNLNGLISVLFYLFDIKPTLLMLYVL